MSKCLCKSIKIIWILISMVSILGIIVYFIFMKTRCRNCKCLKNKANKIFDEMGEAIGEITYYLKKK